MLVNGNILVLFGGEWVLAGAANNVPCVYFIFGLYHWDLSGVYSRIFMPPLLGGRPFMNMKKR